MPPSEENWTQALKTMEEFFINHQYPQEEAASLATEAVEKFKAYFGENTVPVIGDAKLVIQQILANAGSSGAAPIGDAGAPAGEDAAEDSFLDDAATELYWAAF
jgi:hypothetical protein